MRRSLWILLFAIFLSACGAAAGPIASDNTAETAKSNDAVVDIQNQLPADIQISTYQGDDILGGREVDLSEVLSQGKPVVLNFWAGLCPPCRLEMPDLQAVHEQYGDDVILFGLDVGPFMNLGSREDGKALIQELGVTYPAGTTFDNQVVRDYRIIGMPSTLFITPKGEVLRTWTGLLTEDKLAELIEELLDASNAG